MLDVSAQNLYAEVEQAQKSRDAILNITQTLIESYAGPNYREDWSPENPTPENHYWEYVVNVLPRLVYNNPRVSVKSRRPRVQRELVKAMKHGLNRWTADVDLAGTLNEVGMDMLFSYGVTLTTLEHVPGSDQHDNRERRLRPRVMRIDPNRFFVDPEAESFAKARFMGHAFIADRKDLLAAKKANGQPKYNRKLIKEIPTDGEVEEILMRTSGGRKFENRVSRDQIVGYEVYVPETGMIYTLTAYQDPHSDETQSRFLRAPRKAYTPPWGPYTLFGVYLVPSQVYPLAPLAATVELVGEINAHADYLSRTAEQAKTMHFVNASNYELLQTLKHGQTGNVYPIENWEGEFQTVEVGRPSEQAYSYIQTLRERLDRQSGLTQLQRGQTTGGDTTATEANIASQSGDVRLAYMKNQWHGDVRQVLKSAAWFMFNTAAISFPVPLPKELAGGVMSDDGESEDGMFKGGLTEEERSQGFEFNDLELEIDPYSMEFESSPLKQRRVLQTFNLIVGQFAPGMLQFPFLNWRELYRDVTEAMDIRDGSKYVDFEKLEMLVQQRFEAGAYDPVPGIDGAPPVDDQGLKGLPGPSVTSEYGGAEDPMVQELAGVLGSANAAA